jgi:hypothetical protein
MTPFEEIARDYSRFADFLERTISAVTPEWVSAIGTSLQGLAVIAGLVFAWRQISAWRSEAVQRRAAEVAEELLVAVYEVSDVLMALRAQVVRVPIEHIGNNQSFYRYRLERVSDKNSIFENLRLRQIRARAVFQSNLLDASVDEIFHVRHLLVISLDMLASMDLDDSQYAEDRQLAVKLRRDASGSYKEDDELGIKQLRAVERIEKLLHPKILLNSNL